MLLALSERAKRLQKSSKQTHYLRMYYFPYPEYCSIKLNNAYGYAFDVVQNGGIARSPES